MFHCVSEFSVKNRAKRKRTVRIKKLIAKVKPFELWCEGMALSLSLLFKYFLFLLKLFLSCSVRQHK